MRRLFVVFALLALMLAFGTAGSAQTQTEENQTIHVVQPGENLFRISLRYDVTIAQIQQANNIANTNLIFVGQRLIIPTAGTPPPSQPPQQPQPPSQPSPSTYTVQRGDTLGTIARRFGTTFQAIAQANNVANPNLIFPGQVLQIPGGTGQPQPPSQPQPQPPPSAPIAGGFELGGHVQSFSYPDQMRGAGMNWVKNQLVWRRGQPPSIAQPLIDQARANGFKILLGVVGDPGELGANRTQYIQEFATFLAGVAQLGPDAIEVWNEPNIERQWPTGQIGGAAYTQMLSAAFSAIKNANSNVLVISGAPAPTGAEGAFGPARVMNDDRFLREMAAAGAGNFMDCLGIHYNEGIVPPTARTGDPRGNGGYYTRYYLGMIDVYRGIFPNEPLCFTELGYLSGEGYGPLPPAFAWAADTTVQEQAEWLNGTVRIARQRGDIRLIIIWNVDFTVYNDDPQAGYAIVRPDGTCPACATLRAAMQ
ncbi:MAG: LysM peptidoglycan-binding domain-containing protein [Chloroflexota bacterium]